LDEPDSSTAEPWNEDALMAVRTFEPGLSVARDRAVVTMRAQGAARAVGITPILTLVLWIGCLAVGAIGLKLPYPGAREPATEAEPVKAKLIDVKITNDRTIQPEAGPPSGSESPKPAKATVVQEPEIPALPPVPAVAAPSPAIAFAVPVEGPTRIVEAKAAPARPSAMAATAPNTRDRQTPAPSAAAAVPAADAPQQLTFGEGEGKQPAPEYPREAVIARQEGTVVVRFTVGRDGRVRNAEASTPSPSALLNQAAVRAVRETWRFNPGPVRTYEVSIQFELNER
jgi:periplasmic protein TonB